MVHRPLKDLLRMIKSTDSHPVVQHSALGPKRHIVLHFSQLYCDCTGMEFIENKGCNKRELSYHNLDAGLVIRWEH